jgi:hypothetical protein
MNPSLPGPARMEPAPASGPGTGPRDRPRPPFRKTRSADPAGPIVKLV